MACQLPNHSVLGDDFLTATEPLKAAAARALLEALVIVSVDTTSKSIRS